MLRMSIAGRVLALTAALWLGFGPVAAANPLPLAQPNPAWRTIAKPGVSAGAAILMDWQTGEVLFEKDAHRPRDPASTTKVLTAIIALEQGKMDDQVKISRRAAYTPGSSMYIKPGEVYSLHDLLHGLLLRSGNDAAVAIAEHLSGSVEEFAKVMTAKARQIGARNSQFRNPHGLTVSGHHSSAYDLALITRYALQNPTFREIVAQPEKPLTFENLGRDVVLYNTNRLLRIMPEADGVKTGTTAAAGACLISSATRDEHKLIAVVLHAGNRWNDSARLLNWGFDNFRLAYLGRKGEVLLSTPVRNGKPEAVPLVLADDMPLIVPRKAGELPDLEVKVAESIEAPIRKGDALGQATIREGGKVKAEAVLYAGQDVAERTLLDNIIRGLMPLLRWMTDGNMR